MRTKADKFLDVPLRAPARLLLVLLVVPLLLSFLFPLWRISMQAPQYPDGLSMDIYSYKLVGGNDGHDVQEINVLNHYIGMRSITRDELRDLDWMPFALAAMALLALRAALLGTVRTMIDLSMITAFVSTVAFGRFVWMLWEFGHELDPKAPVRVEPFMPVVFGSKKIANFMTHSMPALGSVLMGAFTAGIWGITLWYLWRGRRDGRALQQHLEEAV
jgi:copper chaperone NosL